MSKSWLNYNSFNTTLGSQTYDLVPEWGFPTFLDYESYGCSNNL